ncbi:hypothetical protein K0B03_03515 [Patescibacteria group bacterium]|nr:hypothetical protein [Patescibacteria group bacterium]
MSTPEKQHKKGLSAQKYLEISEIKDGIVIMKNGSMKAILMVSSINFALKSIDEQDAIVYHYQSFLNSLDFSIQIVVNSRQLNLDNYLQVLKDQERKQLNELLRMQISSYIQYIQGLVKMANIVSKTFYVVIPFSASESAGGAIKSLTGGGASRILNNRATFEKYKDQLFQRVDHVIENLSGTGLHMTLLNTQELIELYYNLYNPELSEKEGLAEMSDLDLSI